MICSQSPVPVHGLRVKGFRVLGFGFRVGALIMVVEFTSSL